MPSVWDSGARSTWDPTARGGVGSFRPATVEEIARQDKLRDEQRRRSRNQFIKGSILGTAGVVAGGYGLAALTGGLGAGGGSTLAGMMPTGAPAAGTVPAGTMAAGVPLTGAAPLASTSLAGPAAFAPYATPLASQALAPSVWASTAAGAGGGGGGGGALGYLGRTLTGRDLVSLAGTGVNAGLNIWGTRSANSAADRAAEEQRRQYDLTQQFLKEQDERAHQDYLDEIAEQKRQWEAEQAEKIRQWEAMEPWRQAGQANLTRMNALMDIPGPERLPLSALRRG